MNAFAHEKLDVYQAAIKLVALMDEVVENLPRGRAYLANQLQRAATSVPLNIAEGAGEYSGPGKREASTQWQSAQRPSQQRFWMFADVSSVSRRNDT